MTVSVITQRAHDFDAFVRDLEPGLRRALVASFGPVAGRAVTVDALSWAWENWERLATIDNKRSYLYRVGRSALRHYESRTIPVDVLRGCRPPVAWDHFDVSSASVMGPPVRQ